MKRGHILDVIALIWFSLFIPFLGFVFAKRMPVRGGASELLIRQTSFCNGSTHMSLLSMQIVNVKPQSIAVILI